MMLKMAGLAFVLILFMSNLIAMLSLNVEYELLPVARVFENKYRINGQMDGYTTIGPSRVNVRFDGFIGKLRLRATVSSSSIFEVLDMTDTNSGCGPEGRKLAWFKDGLDPYTMSGIVNFGSYNNFIYPTGCANIFKGFMRNSTSASLTLEREKEQLKVLAFATKEYTVRSAIRNVTKGLNNNRFHDQVNNLHNSVSKLKGMLYFRYQDRLSSDVDTSMKFSNIDATQLAEKIFGQVELITLTGQGKLLSDLSMAMRKWQ